jgi:glyoxylase-like metal-dependent hydrolase (beta-lactamase superfamily II)
VIATPGHTADDITVIVNGKFNGEEAIVAITGLYYQF